MQYNSQPPGPGSLRIGGTSSSNAMLDFDAPRSPLAAMAAGIQTDYSTSNGGMIGPRSMSKRPQLTPVVVPSRTGAPVAMGGPAYASTSASATSSTPSSNGAQQQHSPTRSKAMPPTPLSARMRAQQHQLTDSSSQEDHTVFSPGPPSASSGSASGDIKGKRKANPLEDLIETEALYVADLGAIIKRVAGAWSRTNFPPPELDSMFRAIEGVYRINKSLLAKLNEIGPSPSSPKALGDLLMGWVVEIEPAYSRFAGSYRTGFDTFPPILANSKVRPTLDDLEWPKTLPATPSQTSLTLDDLFSLPVNRIAYYKKLFSKLLRSTKEGKSDHALLVEANSKLDRVANECKRGATIKISQPDMDSSTATSPPLPAPPLSPEITRQATLTRMPRSASLSKFAEDDLPRDSNEGRPGSEEENSISFNGMSSTERFSSATSQSNVTGNTTLPSPVLRIDNIERKLNCDRTLDLFTMQPRKCKLQISPPALRYPRNLRKTGDVTVYFTPSSDPSRRELVTPSYIVLLTDLLLICQRMAPHEGFDGQEMWLMYPPLSGKHLTLRDEGDQLRVGIMQREWLVFAGLDWRDKEEWRRALEDAITFSNSTGQQNLHVTSDLSARSTPSPTASSSQHSMFRNSPSPLPSPLSVDSHGKSPAMPGNDGFDRPLPPPGLGNVEPFLQDPRQGPSPNRPMYAQDQHAPLPPRKQSARQGSLGVGDRPMPPPGAVPRSASASDQAPPRSRGEYGSIGHSTLPNGRPPVGVPPARTASKASNYAHGNSGYADSIQSNASLRSQPRSTSRNDGPLPSPGAFGDRRQFSGSTSNRAPPPQNLQTLPDRFVDLPPVPKSANPLSARTDPGGRPGLAPPEDRSIYRSRSAETLGRGDNQQRYHVPPLSSMPSLDDRQNGGSYNGRYRQEDDFRPGFDSPPDSPVSAAHEGPTTTSVTASMKCKAFLQHGHAQWKSLGLARLQLFVTEPGNTKQLVVESDKSDRKTFVSTIVLTDAVERVGKTGVAIELGDNGRRTGIVYMLQMKNEQSATGLFEQLLRGSDRGVAQKLGASGSSLRRA